VDQLPETHYGLDYQVEHGCEASTTIASPNVSTIGGPSMVLSHKRSTSDLRRKTSTTMSKAKTGNAAKQERERFKDGFEKPVGWQPPIWQVLEPAEGVVMTCMGNTFPGPTSRPGLGRMTRRQYERLVTRGARPSSAGGAQLEASGSRPDEQDAADRASGTRPNTAPGSMLGSRPGTKDAAPSAVPTAAWPAGQSEAHEGSARMPGSKDGHGSLANGEGQGQPRRASRASRTSHASGGGAFGESVARDAGAGAGGGGGSSTEDHREAQRAPTAPAWRLRAQKNQGSLGCLRPPRLRVAVLGGVRHIGPAQPPLGATMGHGLLRAGDSTSCFFFPSEKMAAARMAKRDELRRSNSAGEIGSRTSSRPPSAASQQR